jgi:hypothetical protein
VFSTPLLAAGTFKNVSFTESSTMIGQFSTLSINIIFSNSISTLGTLITKFPASLYYLEGAIPCLIENKPTNCTYTS